MSFPIPIVPRRASVEKIAVALARSTPTPHGIPPPTSKYMTLHDTIHRGCKCNRKLAHKTKQACLPEGGNQTRNTHVNFTHRAVVRQQPRVEVALHHRWLPPGFSRRFCQGIAGGFSAGLGVHGHNVIARSLRDTHNKH